MRKIKMEIESILSTREKMALDILLAMDKISEKAKIEFETEKGHIISLKLGWFSLAGEMDLLCYFRRLENLEIHNCTLGNIPEEFALLTHLKSLTISFFDIRKDFEIKDLFPTIFFIGNLEELTLERVIIDEIIEDALGDLGNLVKLHLNHCGFSHFPKSIYNLHRLKDLSLAGNDIDDFPERLFSLPLEKFFITNQFKMDFKDEH